MPPLQPSPSTSGLPTSGGPGAEPTAHRIPRPGVSPAVLSSQRSPLDQLETSSQPRVNRGDDEACDQPAAWRNPDSIPFEHRGWQPMRRKIYAAMCRTDQTNARKHAFWTCADRIHVMTHPTTHEVDLHPETCHDRFCLPCGQRRSRRIAGAVENLMKPRTSRLMFLTLTVRGRPGDSLTSMLDRLRNAWKELRRLKGWTNTIKGGVVMLEVKWSHTSGGHWHPHYHLICEGSWLDKQWLRDAWHLITRDSDQVDVQRIVDHSHALRYVSKYASKPVDSSFVMRQNLLDEAMVALKGVRLAACFGSWHGTPLSKGFSDAEKDDTEVLTAWVYRGTTADLEARAAKYDREAALLLASVERILRLRHTLTLRRRGAATMHGPPDSESPDANADGFGTPALIAAR